MNQWTDAAEKERSNEELLLFVWNWKSSDIHIFKANKRNVQSAE